MTQDLSRLSAIEAAVRWCDEHAAMVEFDGTGNVTITWTFGGAPITKKSLVEAVKAVQKVGT